MTLPMRCWLAPLLLLAALPLVAEEEPPAKQAESDPEVIEARGRLANEIDKLAVDAYADLMPTLVADNPLGIDVTSPDAALRAQLGLGEDEGLVVTNVPAESVGAKAGLKVHDVIVGLDAHKVGNIGKLAEWLGAAEGKSVTLKVRRAGKPIELTAELNKPAFARVRLTKALGSDLATFLVDVVAERYRIGVTLSAADETLQAQLGLAAGEGLVVTEVVSASPAELAGVRMHDVLTLLDGKRLTTVEAINAQIQEIKDRSVKLRLLRGGKEMTIEIAPRKTKEEPPEFQNVKLWDTSNCKSCHKDTHADPHRLMGENLGDKLSVWTDGEIAKIHRYEDAFRAQVRWAELQDFRAKESSDAPQQQIDALKTQLIEMQKTLAALESSLRPPPVPATTNEEQD
jgi:membrane-associated protease RseP (regulator of RpoE activity)